MCVVPSNAVNFSEPLYETKITVVPRNRSVSKQVAQTQPPKPPRQLPSTCTAGKPKPIMWTKYHKDIFMPVLGQSLYRGYSKFKFSDKNTHLQHRLSQRGIAISSQPQSLNEIKSAITIFELQLEGVQLYAQGIRFKYDEVFDVCLIVRPDGFVITAWLNAQSDSHKTLRTECYHTQEDYNNLIFN